MTRMGYLQISISSVLSELQDVFIGLMAGEDEAKTNAVFKEELKRIFLDVKKKQ